MNKTNPIGVRFRQDVLEKLKNDHGIDSPQKALIFLERFYCNHHLLAKDITAPLRDGASGTNKALVLKKPSQKAGNKAKEPDMSKPAEIVQPTPETYNGSKIDQTKTIAHTTTFDEKGNIVQDLKIQQLQPKTLEELKTMCPKEITGIDRSLWIAEERKKYGI